MREMNITRVTKRVKRDGRQKNTRRTWVSASRVCWGRGELVLPIPAVQDSIVPGAFRQLRLAWILDLVDPVGAESR